MIHSLCSEAKPVFSKTYIVPLSGSNSVVPATPIKHILIGVRSKQPQHRNTYRTLATQQKLHSVPHNSALKSDGSG